MNNNKIRKFNVTVFKVLCESKLNVDGIYYILRHVIYILLDGIWCLYIHSQKIYIYMKEKKKQQRSYNLGINSNAMKMHFCLK